MWPSTAPTGESSPEAWRQHQAWLGAGRWLAGTQELLAHRAACRWPEELCSARWGCLPVPSPSSSPEALPPANIKFTEGSVLMVKAATQRSR